MKEKNRDKDRWISEIRAPYERVFVHHNKNSLSRVGESTVSGEYSGVIFNLKRLMTLGVDRITLCHT